MTAQYPVSLWDASALEQDYQSGFSGERTVDLAIVGGRYIGLSTALPAVQKGLSALVIEAEQVGFGGFGRNCGLGNAALWVPPQTVRAKLGQTYGPRFLEIFGMGPEYVFSLIEQHQIRCEAIKTGTIHAAHAPNGFRDLQSRHAELQRMGEPVDLLSRDEVAERTGTLVFHGGLLDHRAGTINPMAYCRCLARVAVAVRARISTGLRATKLRRDGNLWTVETTAGVITANSVVLGTNAYTDALWPDLNRIFTKIHYFQFATKPMRANATRILPGREGVWDTGQIMFNVRRDSYDRLLIGSVGTVIGGRDGGLSNLWARRQIKRLFPSMGPLEFEEAWHGQIAVTPDHLPRIYELDQGLFIAIGHNGRHHHRGAVWSGIG